MDFRRDLTKEEIQFAENSCNQLNHRGPDSSGTYSNDSLFLGHKRLSIIDLSDAGKQPMISENGRYVIVFNGEIYNYLELKERYLDDLDYNLQSSSDTEVLLELYIKLGSKAFNLLNGMYAFIIYDKDTSKIVVCRDRFGIKPIYYYKTDEFIVYASEIKSILPYIDSNQPNKKLIAEYLTQGRLDHRDETFFNDIYRFPAGHFCEINIHPPNIEYTRYWHIEDEIQKVQKSSEFQSRTEEDHLIHLRELLLDAINIRYRSDVPVGACLSGGLDSSGIVNLSLSHFNNEYDLNTYSAVFGEWFEKDETSFISLITQQDQIKEFLVTPKLEDINSQFVSFIETQEEPVLGYSQFIQYKVMELASKNNQKVLLDGQGADEILAGYPYMRGYLLAEYFVEFKWIKFFSLLTKELREKNFIGISVFLAQFIPQFIKKRLILNNTEYLTKEFKIIAKSSDFLNSGFYNSKDLNKALVHHLEYKLQDLLRWEDKNSMAFSIESRTPYLDYRVVLYVLSLPSDFKIRDNYSKWCLRQILPELPDEIRYRVDKIGFASPDTLFLSDNSNIHLNNLKTDPHPYLYKIFEEKKLSYIINRIFSNDIHQSHETLIFRILCLDLWLKTYFPT